MGEVWLARHELLARDVAVKILSGALTADGGRAWQDFLRGARVAAGLGHPGLNTVYHADVSGGVPYLVLEYLDGLNLDELMARSGPPELSVVRAVLEAVTDAVAQLHQHDLVHRDVKPSNVMLTRDGRVVLTDFGLACAGPGAALRGGGGGVVAGTPGCMAPEMFDGVVSARTDVYSIGMTAYQLLCGRPAFTGRFDELRRQHEQVPIDLAPLRSAGVPDAVIDAVVHATSKNLLFRPKSARHLGDAFRAAFDSAGVLPAPRESLARLLGREQHGVAGASPSDPRWIRRRRADRIRTWVGGCVGTVFGGVAAIAVLSLFTRIGPWWQRFVEVDLAHATAPPAGAPPNSFMPGTPFWAILLIIAVPNLAFGVTAFAVSWLLYRLVRGSPLPPDEPTTTCGWCRHELHGISEPVCPECGHRVGDRGPDGSGAFPPSRRAQRRWAVVVLLPTMFLATTFATAIVVSLAGGVVAGVVPALAALTGFRSIYVAVFPGLVMALLLYEAVLQFDLRHGGRAWCRACKRELRALVEPACPHCGTRI